MPSVFTAFYLSIFIAATRKIAGRFTVHPTTKNDYYVTIPFCDHCIIAGRYRSLGVATRAKSTIELESEYSCDLVPAGALYDYVRTKGDGSFSSIFDDDRTCKYLTRNKLIILRAFIRDYEAEN